MTMEAEAPQQTLMVDAREKDPESSSSERSDTKNTPEITYPSVWRQAIIVTGLLLGIFLVSCSRPLYFLQASVVF